MIEDSGAVRWGREFQKGGVPKESQEEAQKCLLARFSTK